MRVTVISLVGETTVAQVAIREVAAFYRDFTDTAAPYVLSLVIDSKHLSSLYWITYWNNLCADLGRMSDQILTNGTGLIHA